MFPCIDHAFATLSCSYWQPQPASPAANYGNVAQWVAALIALAALILAAISARWAAKQWRLQYFTKEWAQTLQFLFANPSYLNPEKNRNYQTKYDGDEAVKYDLIARLSIGYVDDLYHLKTGKYLSSWLRGSVQVFVSPHSAWFLDHKDAYDPNFVSAMQAELEVQDINESSDTNP